MPENPIKPAEVTPAPNAGNATATKIDPPRVEPGKVEQGRPVDLQSRPRDLPKATRAGTKPHLQEDAKFRVIHPCAVSCRSGDLVPRSQLRPRANGGREELEAATDDVIERLISLGAIAHEPQEEKEEGER